MALNLEKQLLFYGSYHHDPANIAIHITCVPLILMTSILFGTNTQPLAALPSWLTIQSLPPNFGVLIAVTYGALYVLMEPVAGGLLAPLLLAGTAGANHLTKTYGATANQAAIGVHIMCWIGQFIGHGVFEGRSPALFDNLVQALFLAPFFVWMEILFYFGYRSELKKRLDKAVSEEINKYKKSEVVSNGTPKDGKANGNVVKT